MVTKDIVIQRQKNIANTPEMTGDEYTLFGLAKSDCHLDEDISTPVAVFDNYDDAMKYVGGSQNHAQTSCSPFDPNRLNIEPFYPNSLLYGYATYRIDHTKEALPLNPKMEGL